MIEKPTKTLYYLIGPAFITTAVTEFYRRAFADSMIGHFFFNSDIEHIITQQIHFVTAILGGPQEYRGKPLRIAHAPFSIRPPHFGRRQVLMREVLTDLGLEITLVNGWLAVEEQFRAVILNADEPCK